MKRLIPLIALFFILNSCSTDNGPRYSLVLLPVDSVSMPTSFTLGGTYQITMHYKKPSTCHYFNTLYYDKNLNVRTIAIENAVEERSDCQTLSNTIVDYSFNFLVTSNGGSYIFKFWQGKDANGNDIFLQYEVPVN
jgi:hypothetical protein